MKKWSQRLLVLAFILLFLPSIGSFILKDQTSPTSLEVTQTLDRYNMLIKQQSVYVKIDEKHEPKEEETGYLYQQLAYQDNGDSYMLSFKSPERLSEGSYLELEAKGTCVKSWKEISQTEVPAKALTALDLIDSAFSDSDND